MADILVLTTGGTIGAEAVQSVEHQPHIKTMPHDRRDNAREALSANFSQFNTRCEALEHRDSNFIDEPYRLHMAGLIEAAPEKKILITHGTDTILVTAEFFHQRALSVPALSDKFIIVTGAMVPLANGPQSDGYRNMDFALNYLMRPDPDLPKIGVVLCGFATLEARVGDWGPRYYPFEPGKYERYYDPNDDRLSGLKLAGCNCG